MPARAMYSMVLYIDFGIQTSHQLNHGTSSGRYLYARKIALL